MMRQAGQDRHGLRVRALVAVLWRGGLRISEALALNETDIFGFAVTLSGSRSAAALPATMQHSWLGRNWGWPQALRRRPLAPR